MRRRRFIKAFTLLGGLLGAGQTSSAALGPATRIVDTHTHFYDPMRAEGVPWPRKGTPLYRPVYPSDWLKVASPLGVQQTVVVEASAWLEDNQWLLELAAQNPCIVGVVGRLAPEVAEFAGQVKRFAANPIFLGIRLGGDLSKLIEQPEFRRGLKLMADAGLSVDINGPAKVHGAVADLARQYRALPFVLNHVGSAGDAARLSDDWRKSMSKLGELENVFCKVSALGEQTEKSREHYGESPRDSDYYMPILDHCWESFGEQRLIYGSNWPVCEKGGTYADQFRIVCDFFGSKGSEACENYFWKNARQAYRWRE